MEETRKLKKDRRKIEGEEENRERGGEEGEHIRGEEVWEESCLL